MRKQAKTIIGASVLAAGLLAAPVVLYAHDNGGGMMGGDSGSTMGNGSMMGQGSGGMMGMMGQMSQMMANCNSMMQSMNHGGSGRPNDQWRKDVPRNEGMSGKNG